MPLHDASTRRPVNPVFSSSHPQIRPVFLFGITKDTGTKRRPQSAEPGLLSHLAPRVFADLSPTEKLGNVRFFSARLWIQLVADSDDWHKNEELHVVVNLKIGYNKHKSDVRAQNDPAKARLIWARGPSAREEVIRLTVSSKATRSLLEAGRLSALGEYMGLILLEGVLAAPVAIFQGVRRPYFAEGLDNFVFAYISRPHITYVYYPSDRFAGTGPHRIEAPTDSVFVVFVSLARAVVEEALTELGPQGQDVKGVILGWEWARASKESPSLPDSFGERYRRRVWPT